jgi:GNAT superfamily N-acetyltransferase
MANMAAPDVCTVRPAQPKDSDAMAGLAKQLGYECTGTEVRRRLNDMKDAAQYGIFVATLPEIEVAGWVGAHVFRAIELNAIAEINGLVVDKTVRSRGIGRALLCAAEQWARAAGCDGISVKSNITRDRAHRFYMSNGYELVKTQRLFQKSLYPI